MKKLIAILLALVMCFSLIACEEKPAGKDQKDASEAAEEPALKKGWYRAADEDGETVAYLYSTGKKLTVYNADGSKLMEEAKFKWDEEEEAFVIDGKAAFTVESEGEDLTLTVPKKSPTGLEKGSYTLETIKEEDVPVPGEPKPEPEPEPEPEPGPALYELPSFTVSHSCSLNASLVLNYYVSCEPLEGYDNVQLSVQYERYNGRERTLSDPQLLTPTVDTKANEYRFSFTGITWAEMGSTIYATMTAEKNGVTYHAAEADVYSIALYCYNKIRNASSPAALKTMCVEALNYGAAAQIYFDKNPEHPCNEDLTAEEKALGVGNVTINAKKETVAYSGTKKAEFNGNSYMLENAPELVVYFKTVNGADGSKLTVKCTYQSTDGKEKSSTLTPVQSGSEWYVTLNTVAGPDLRQPITVVIYEGTQQVSDTMIYSAEVYCTSQIGKESAAPELKALCQALMNYSEAAKLYFGSTKPASETKPEVKYAELPTGSYQVRNGDQILGYLSFTGSVLTTYNENSAPVSYEVTFDPATATYSDSAGYACRFEPNSSGTGHDWSVEGKAGTLTLIPFSSIPEAYKNGSGQETKYVELPTGDYQVSYGDLIIAYLSYSGDIVTLYYENSDAEYALLLYDPDTGTYTDDADNGHWFVPDSSGSGYVWSWEGSEYIYKLKRVSSIPETFKHDSAENGPTAFTPGTPTSSDERIPLCRYGGWVFWDMIPEFFIPGWGSAMFSEDEDYSEFMVAAQNDETGVSANFTVTMSPSYGKNGDLIDSILSSVYDVDEPNTIYDTLAEEAAGILAADTADIIVRARCHDLLLDDGTFECNLYMIADNGEVTVSVVNSAFAGTEDDWIEIGDIIFDTIVYFQLKREA